MRAAKIASPREQSKWQAASLHLLNLVQIYVADIDERLLVCDIINEKNAHGATVKTSVDGAKSLIAGSVQDLQFTAHVMNIDSANLEIDANGNNQ